MDVLVTNDDGYQAPGLAALIAVARTFARRVWVVAPVTEQSYAGHRVTTRQVLSPVEYAPDAYHLDGAPADCVRIALRALHMQPWLVLSGINQGGNLGIDVYTSGTVAAAREAAALGIPAIALSQYIAGHALDWERTAALAARAVERVLGREMQPGVYWNVNLPHPAADDELSAVPCVDCDIDPHPQDVRFASQECGGFLYAGRYRERPRQPGSDVDVCFSGQISISRLALA